MNNSIFSTTVNALVRARLDQKAWDASEAKPLANIEDAYAIQDVITQQLGAEIKGWKTSAPDAVSVPIVAPIYSNLIYKSKAQVPSSGLFVIGIEGEIAFRLNKDLPQIDRAYSRDDMISAIDELLPAIEIVDTRMVNGLAGDKNLILADNQSNGGLVVGEGISDWQKIDLSQQAASVTVNGDIKYSGMDSNRAGDIFKLMAWAANHCVDHNRPFRAGDIVTTGTFTGMLFVEPGADVVVNFPEIGTVSVSFPA